MANYVYVGKDYGLKPMSFEEEVNLPKNEKQTRNNKVRIIDDCDSIIRTVESLRHRAFMCPELDDEAHAKLVEEYAQIIKSLRIMADEALGFGYN